MDHYKDIGRREGGKKMELVKELCIRILLEQTIQSFFQWQKMPHYSCVTHILLYVTAFYINLFTNKISV
jgi:hypothetical protein